MAKAKPATGKSRAKPKAIPTAGIDGIAPNEFGVIPPQTGDRPKNQVGLGWFAGSLHEMTREEHIAKLRHFQEHGSFLPEALGTPEDLLKGTASTGVTQAQVNQSQFARQTRQPEAFPTDRPTEGTKSSTTEGSSEQGTGTTQTNSTQTVSNATTKETRRTNGQTDNQPDRQDSETDSENTPQLDKAEQSQNTGDVPLIVAETSSFYGKKAVESVPLARVRDGETRGQCWERLRREGRAAGMTRRGAIAYAGGVIDSLFPPKPLSEPVIVEELPAYPEPEAIEPVEEPASEPVSSPPAAEQGVSGLDCIPDSWGELPDNAQLQAEIAWVSANRLRVRAGTGVDLSRAKNPAPSYAALSWLETSILFPAKFADISVKATSQQDDEKEHIKREKFAIEEIRSILAEMLEAKD